MSHGGRPRGVPHPGAAAIDLWEAAPGRGQQSSTLARCSRLPGLRERQLNPELTVEVTGAPHMEGPGS